MLDNNYPARLSGNTKEKIHKVRRHRQTKQPLPNIAREPLSDDDLTGLDDFVRQKFNKPYTLKPFQRAATIAQLQGKDVLVHAPTGSGKTAIVAGPHAHPQSKGKVTFLVSPLIALQNEQAMNFQDEYGLTAIAINSSHGGLKPENMIDICLGKYEVVVISPEMMLTKRFIKNVLKNPMMARRVLSVVVDEAHVVSHWGAQFRKKYAELGILCAILPKDTPFVALLATLPQLVCADVLEKLRFPKNKDDYIFINLGNNRPNVSLVVRAIEHPMNTYRDLDFIIPENCSTPSDIQKTWVYADSITAGCDIQDHLESCLPKDLQGLGLIRPYSAAYSQKYRDSVMQQFRSGIIRILVCTDAAGMGCNVSDIDLVVQWKLPGSTLSFVQRAGRAVRDPKKTGMAVLLVEKSAFGFDCEQLIPEAVEGKNKPKGKPPARAKSQRTTGEYTKGGKGYADSRGVKRGSYNGESDNLPHAGWSPVIDRRAKDENLLAFVQTGCCRRVKLMAIFGNDDIERSTPCCDICHPDLLNKTRPGSYSAPGRQKAIPKGVIHQPTKSALHQWRVSVYKKYHSKAQWSFGALLSNEHLDLLAAVGPITSLKHLESLLAKQWSWWDQYGQQLWQTIENLEMPPLIPLPKSKKAPNKRVAGEEDVEAPVEVERAKRVRVDGGIRSTATDTSCHRGASHAAKHASQPSDAALQYSRPFTPIQTPASTPASRSIVYAPTDPNIQPSLNRNHSHSQIPGDTPLLTTTLFRNAAHSSPNPSHVQNRNDNQFLTPIRSRPIYQNDVTPTSSHARTPLPPRNLQYPINPNHHPYFSHFHHPDQRFFTHTLQHHNVLNTYPNSRTSQEITQQSPHHSPPWPGQQNNTYPGLGIAPAAFATPPVTPHSGSFRTQTLHPHPSQHFRPGPLGMTNQTYIQPVTANNSVSDRRYLRREQH